MIEFDYLFEVFSFYIDVINRINIWLKVVFNMSLE